MTQRDKWYCHWAGIIAAQANSSVGIAGVANGAKILPIGIIGRCGGRVSDITDAVVCAAGGELTGVPPNVAPAKVFNMSLDDASDTCTPSMQNAMDQARELGATIVTMAGNANAVLGGVCKRAIKRPPQSKIHEMLTLLFVT